MVGGPELLAVVAVLLVVVGPVAFTFVLVVQRRRRQARGEAARGAPEGRR